MAAKKTFLLRIDPALWAELERWAAADFRSINGQIEYVLHRAVSQRRRPAPGTGAGLPSKPEEGAESGQETSACP